MNNESLHADLDPRQIDREERLLTAVRDTLVRRRDTLRLQVPVDLERSIRMALAEERSVPAKESWVQRAIDWIRQPSVSFGMAAATLALIVGLAVLGQRSDALPRELTHAALAAFPGVHSGSTKLDIMSSDKQQISAYLASHGVQHAVFYPEVDAELAGANVFSVNGLPCAELVYKKAKHTIALLQVDDASIDAKRVEMDPIVAEDVAYSKWHWASTPDNGTLFVWKSNSIMCTVVSDLQIDEVSSLFKLEAL
jgi:hypothetical protein